MGAELQCSFGMAPTVLIVEPEGSPVLINGMPAATIMDFAPLVNIPTFAMCLSELNPEVIVATAAALGILTPMPCIPMTTSPWIPGADTVLIDGMPALTDLCTCICDWGGVITVGFPGQATVITNEG